MPRLAANLSTMFTEFPFVERFAAAADAGFRAVEFMFPYDWTAEHIADIAAANALEIVLFNCPAGEWAAGDRGLAALPDRIAECRAGIERAHRYARTLRCRKLHLMAGIATPDMDNEAMRVTLVSNVRHAADVVADDGIDIMLEPINTRIDVPGYSLASTDEAVAIIDQVDRPNVRLQYDAYHMQIMEGDLLRRIETFIDRIGHIQIADNPGRAEPGTGEINVGAILRRLDAIGYRGHIGCEYVPASSTLDGLAWAFPYLERPGRHA